MALIQTPIDPSNLETGTWEEYWINSGTPTGNGSYYYEAPSVDINGNSEIYADNHGIWSESNSGYKGWWWAKETDLTYQGINYDGQAIAVIDADQNSIYDSKVDYVLGYAFGWDNGGTSGTWDRTSDYEGIFSGGAFGAFKITVEMDFKGSNRDDTIIGSTKNDNLLGELGNDEIYGYELNDILYGGYGNDSLYGGTGNDTIDGGLGNDTIDGGYGTDTAVFSKNFSEYSFAIKSGNLQITGARTDILKNIENIKFNDVSKNINKLLELANTASGSSDSSDSSSTPITDGVEVAEVNSSYTADSNGFSSVNGSAPVTITAYTIGQETTLDSIKDYDGNLHAGDNSAATPTAYKYQGMLEVNGDGVFEAIFTNKSSKRWVTAEVNSTTGQIDFDDHGAGGTTRVVGIYIDPLVTSGDVVQYSDHDSQHRFRNDLEIDNLVAKHAGDYDSDGVHEVYWKTADGSAYLRSLMHTDGNIRYANYQSEEQMKEYLTANGDSSVISEIV